MKSSKGKGPVNGSKPPKKLPPTTPGKKQKPKDPVEVSEVLRPREKVYTSEQNIPHKIEAEYLLIQ